MVGENVLWISNLSLILDIKESQVCAFQDAAKYLPSLWLESEALSKQQPSSWQVNTSYTGPHILYPRGQKSPRDYGKSIFSGGSCEV